MPKSSTPARRALASCVSSWRPEPSRPEHSTFPSDVTSQFTVDDIGSAVAHVVAPTSGVTPSTLVATVTPPQGASPGTLSGTIIVGAPASTSSQRTVIPVTLQILAPPQGTLSATPDNITIDYQTGAPPPLPVSVSVTSTGGPATFSLSTSAGWLYAFTNSYVTPAVVQVSVAPTSSMQPGIYGGTVSINPWTYAGGLVKQILVTLRISAAGTLTASPTFLSFSYQPGGLFPAAQTVSIVNSNGVPAPFSVSATTASGGNWLAFSPLSSTTPGNVVVSVNPAGLAPGTYNGTLGINPSTTGVGATQIPITLTVFNFSQLIVEPSGLFFGYQSGGPLPATQYLSVKSTSSPVTYTVSVQGPTWVTVSIGSNTTPSGVGVSVIPPAGTAAGTYSATVRLTPTNGGGNPVSVPVTVSVTNPNYLDLGGSALSFDYSTGGSNPPPAFIPVTSSGASLRFEAAAATAGFSPWLTVNQSSQYTPANLTIGVSPQGLSAGTYSGTIVVSSDSAVNTPQSIAVTLTVTNATSFVASPFGLVFSYQIGQATPTPQLFTVNSQGGSASFSVAASTTSGGNWLTVVGSGPTPGAVAAGVDASALSSGSYTGKLTVSSTDTSIPVLEMPVILNVSAAPVFLPAANQVSFQAVTNGAAPATQTVVINTNGTDSYVFYPTVITADGGPWLTATPSVGVTSSPMTIAVNPAGMTAGLYYGLISINDPAGYYPDILRADLAPDIRRSDTGCGQPDAHLQYDVCRWRHSRAADPGTGRRRLLPVPRHDTRSNLAYG